MNNKEILSNNRYTNNNEKKFYVNPLLTELPKSLKDQHFIKFYNNLFAKVPKLNNLNRYSLMGNSANIINETNKNHKSVNSLPYNPQVNQRKFKDPKNINYKLFKFNPYINYQKEKTLLLKHSNNNSSKKGKKKENKIDDEKITKDIKSITFYNIKFNKKNEIKNNDDIEKSKNEFNRNNLLKNKEYKNIIHQIKSYNDNEKKKRLKNKKYYENNVREKYYGKKDTFGIPYYYDTSIIFKNEYANKSEKNRHEIVLNEFNKLKTYLNRHPDKKLYIIKDFLIKFHMDEIDTYNNKQLLNLCNFITNTDSIILSRFLKPYLNIKNMLYDILNNSLDLHNFYSKENEEKEKNEEINKEANDNFNIKDKENTPPKNMLNKKIYYLSPLIKKKSSKYLTKSIKVRRIHRSKSNILLNETKIDNNFIEDTSSKRKSVILDLDSTNSNLKYMIYQKKTFVPDKSFSNDKIIINEIGKEIKDIENDYNKRLKELEMMKNEKTNNFNHNRKYTINIKAKDKLYINLKNKKNTKLKTFVPIHYNLTKKYNGKMKNLNDIIKNNNELLNSEETHIYRKRLLSLDNCCLNSTERKNKNKSEQSDIKNKVKEKSYEKARNIYNKTDIIKRLYYLPTRKKFGLQEIRNRLKLTEYIALTHAKKKLYKAGII